MKLLRFITVLLIGVLVGSCTAWLWAAPNNQIDVPNDFAAGQVASASQVNANNNEITNKYNVHTHSDIAGSTPGGSNTQVQFNDAGAFGGDADLTWFKTFNVLTVTGNLAFPSNSTPTTRSIYTTNQWTNNTDASDLQLLGGDGLGSGAGGDILVWAGAAGATGGGGAVDIRGGGATAGAGGSIDLDAGNGVGGAGGGITIFAGDATGTANTGTIQMLTETPADGDAGDLNISLGDAAGTNNDGGGILTTFGKSTGNGQPGVLSISRRSGTGMTNRADGSPIFYSNGPTNGLADGTTITQMYNNLFDEMNIDGVAGGGTELVLTAATVAINAAPGGTNRTIANPYAFYVISGSNRFGGDVVLQGKSVYTPSSSQAITAVGSTIAANATIVVLRPNGNYTLTSTPTISDGYTGQCLYVTESNGEVNVVTVQDQDSLGGSNLQLGAASRAIGNRDVLTLIFDGTDWIEQNYADN